MCTAGEALDADAHVARYVVTFVPPVACGCEVSVCWVCTCVTIAMAGWLHGVCVGACWVVSPQGGFSLSLFCNYLSPAMYWMTHK